MEKKSAVMEELAIHDYARQLFDAHGNYAIVEAAQKALAFEQKNDKEQAEAWRQVEAALKLIRGPNAS